MHKRLSQPEEHQAPRARRQTGPRTAAGKARSAMNSVKHGLTARAAVLPGEDPDVFEQHMAAVIDSLDPVGAVEEELARVAANALWRLRRSGRWEAARARLAAAADRDRQRVRVAEVEETIERLRGTLADLQRDPAASPPLLVLLWETPDATPVDGYDIAGAYIDWANHVPDSTPIPSLEELCRRIGLPDEGVQEPRDWTGWTDAHLRLLVGEFAKALGMTPDDYVRDAHTRWKAELPDQRAHLRRRRSEVRREIKNLELRREDLAVDQAAPDELRLDLLGRYEATALRMVDKAIKTLQALQEARRRQERAPATRKRLDKTKAL